MLKFSVASRTNGTLRKIPGSSRWVVQEPFYWCIDYASKSRAIVIPAGFGTDFGNIPRILHPILSPTKYIAYILHDYLYTFGPQLGISRKEADLILAEALMVEGMSRLGMLCVYVGVRVGGSTRYIK